MSDDNDNNKPPTALTEGTLRGTSIRVFVLDDEGHTPVLMISDFMEEAVGERGRSIRNLMKAECLKPYFNLEDTIRNHTIKFRAEGLLRTCRGLTAEGWGRIARALVTAQRDENLNGPRLQRAAAACSIILSACADVGMKVMMRADAGWKEEQPVNHDINKAVQDHATRPENIHELKVHDGGKPKREVTTAQMRLAWKDFTREVHRALKSKPSERAIVLDMAVAGFHQTTG